MLESLNNEYLLNSPENDINEFLKAKENTLKIISAMEPHLNKYFPDNEFSLEICDN